MPTIRRTTACLSILGALALTGVSASAAAAQSNPARITAEERVAPRVVELTISTPAFATPTKVDVDLPAGYDADPHRRWPVSYFLAGMQNTYKSFNNVVDGVGLTADYPSIVVSPNGDSGYWSDWYNAGAGGPPQYETYVIDQLIPLIDAHFRTIADRSHRLLAGVSMGGYGAMMFAARHPDLFSAVASISGAVDSNLALNGLVLSVSPTLQGGKTDAIYGPRSTEEARWRGHNPTDLAANLKSLDLQVRTANGVLNTGIGENPLSPDAVSCVVEKGVHDASVSMHDTLDRLHLPHLWKDYGAGCHTVPNFKREITDTLTRFKQDLAHPAAPPKTFDYASIEPDFAVWGWRVTADPDRALEFLRLKGVGPTGGTFTGSGRTTVTTPPLFPGLRRVDVNGRATAPDTQGRIRFTVDLGAADTGQEYRPGSTTKTTTRTVTFRPYARIVTSRVQATRRQVQVCASSVGGRVTAHVHVTSAGGRRLARSTAVTLTSANTCRTLRRNRRSDRRATVAISGRDRFGHRIAAQTAIRVPAPARG
jgi:S-formylglutathione hydrolase FrmB